MAIFSFVMNIFKIAFQDVADNGWKIPVLPFSAIHLVRWHCFSVLGKHLFLQFCIRLLNETPGFPFCFGKWFAYMRPSKPFLHFSIHGKVFKIRYLKKCIFFFWGGEILKCVASGMTDICVKIYRCHLLYAREYWVAVVIVGIVVAGIVVT